MQIKRMLLQIKISQVCARTEGRRSGYLEFYPFEREAVLHLQVLALGNVPLTCGWFCERGLIHHKPFWKHQAKPATFFCQVTAQQGQTTTPGTLRALLFSNSAWDLLRPAGLWTMKNCETGPTVLSSLSEKTRKSNHLLSSLSTSHFFNHFAVSRPIGHFSSLFFFNIWSFLKSLFWMKKIQGRVRVKINECVHAWSEFLFVSQFLFSISFPKLTIFTILRL